MLNQLRDRRRDRRRSGFSLLELMVTMGLATVLIGTGAGVYIKMGRRSAATQAIASVGQLVMRAKNASNRFPATLVADPEEGLLHAYTDEILQELHFEERASDSGPWVPMGIDGRTCEPQSAKFVADSGRVGGGLQVMGGSIDCGKFAAYDVSEGLNAEVWIRPTSDPKCDIVSKGQTFHVKLESTSGRSSRLVVRVQVQDASGIQEKLTRTVQIPPVRVGEWVGIRVSYDRMHLVTATSDGHGFVTRDSFKDDKQRRLAVDPDANLVIAAGLTGFVDDVRIGGVRSGEPLRLPAGVGFHGKNTPIRFDGGRLDPAVHSGPATIAIAFDGTVSTFDIGQGGQILAVRQTDVAATPVDAAKPVKAPTAPVKKE